MCKIPSHDQQLWETMGKSVRYFIIFVVVLCLSVASEAGFFDKVSRSLTLWNKITQKLKGEGR